MPTYPPNGTFTPYTLPPVLSGVPSVVMRYNADGSFTPLPLVRWTEITYRKGPHPPRATFRFAFVPGTTPAGFERVLPLTKAAGPNDIVAVDDRIVVATIDATGAVVFLFDGFVQTPEMGVSGQQYALQFQCQGVAIRCWDYPLVGSWRRDASDPTNTAKATYCEGIPAKVNPDGRANATGANPAASSYDFDWLQATNPGVVTSPLFLDEYLPETRTDLWPAGYITRWTLEMAARYLLAVGNATEQYVANPDFAYIKGLLQAMVPAADGTIDPTNPTFAPIYLRELVISGKPWPEALADVLEHHGFSFSFRLGSKNGLPYNWLTIDRERDGYGSPVKSLYLQPAGTTVNPGQSNVRSASLALDASQIKNAYVVDVHADEYEVGVILAPGFQVSAGDADAGNLAQWKTSNTSTTVDRRKYRVFVADENGEGHMGVTVALGAVNYTWVYGSPFDFSSLWGSSFVPRRRPGYGPCFTEDNEGNRVKPQLGILCNVASAIKPPMLFDKSLLKSGTYVPVKGSWVLLDRQLGIQITASDPSKWSIGDIDPSNPASSILNGGVVNLVDKVVNFNPRGSTSNFYLVLTCVIEADRQLGGPIVAAKRASSPTTFQLAHYIDSRDRYRRWVVHQSSAYQRGNGALAGVVADDPAGRYVDRDDGPLAQQYANGLRQSTENAQMGGSITIGRLTNQYSVGDRLAQIVGRMDLTTSASVSGNLPRLPSIVQLTWRNEPEQTTTLAIDDRRMDAPSGDNWPVVEDRSGKL